MGYEKNYSEDKNFYKEFQKVNPALIFGYIIISLGLYIINWIYLRNKDFEKIDEFAPNSNRGAAVMMILPFSWFFIIFILKKLIFGHDSLFIGILEIVGFGIILFLVLKYLFDFCSSFGRITGTNGILWFLFFLFGISGLTLMAMKIYFGSILAFFIIPLVPAMQAELNSYFLRFSMRKKNNIYYS